MTSIFPDGSNGGVAVRDASGNPIPVNNVPNAYVPAAEFETSCDITYLRNDCYSRVAPGQMNAVVSELVCLAEYMGASSNDGWDCDSLCNLRTAFQTWVSNFVSEGLSTDLCGLPNGAGGEADAAVIYCGSGLPKKLPLRGTNSLMTMIGNLICQASGLSNPPQNAGFISCDNTGMMRSTPLSTIRLYRGIWAQAFTYSTGQMVQRDGKLWSPNAAIPAGTPFAIGTTGATWYEVSPSGVPAVDPSVAYAKDAIIARNGEYYAANADIPPGTPFVIGTTGQTWRPIDFTQTYIFDHNTSTAYTKDTVVTVGGLLYRANIAMAPGVFNPANWTLIGGEKNMFLGTWVTSRAYITDNMVIQNGKLYAANGPIPANTAFTIDQTGAAGATWREVSQTTLTGTTIQVEFVMSFNGGWLANEHLMVYKAAKATTMPVNLTNSKGLAAEKDFPLNSSIAILINDSQVGTITVVGDLVTINFPNAYTLAVNDVLKLRALSEATFDFVALNLLLQQLL